MRVVMWLVPFICCLLSSGAAVADEGNAEFLPNLPQVSNRVSIVPYAVTDSHARKGVMAEGQRKYRRARKYWKQAQGVPQPARNYIQAVLLEREGKSKKALRKQIAVAGGDWALRHHAAYRAGKLLRKAGRVREAIPFLRQAMGADSLRGEASLDLVWCLQQEGRQEEALGTAFEALDGVYDRRLRSRLLLMTAHLLMRMDRKEEALPILHDLHLSEALDDGLAEKALEALYGESWSRLELFKCLLIDGRRTWKRRLEKLPEEPKEDWDQYRKAMFGGWLQKRYRKREEALVTLEEAVNLAQTPLEKAMASYLKARTLEALDRDLEARDIYDEILDEHPNFVLARSLLVRNATISIREGQAIAGLGYIDRFIASRYPGEDCSEVLWLRGFVHLLAGSHRFAEQSWKELQQRYFYQPRSPWEYYGPMAMYWRSQALVRMGDDQKATDLLRFLSSEWAGSYYAVLANQRLSETGARQSGWSAGDPTVSPSAAPESLPMTPEYSGAAELYRLGMWEEAWREIHALIPRVHFRGVTAWMGATWFRFHPHYDTLGYRRAVGTLPAPWQQGARLWWRSLPLDYLPSIEKGAEENRLSPALIASMIRFESNFHTDARSGAGAIGLIQLKRDTARSVARACVKDRRRLRSRHLMQPELNVRLGTIYMRELLVRHHGHVGMALAAFNAGPGAAKWWMARFAGLPPSTLVEQITYPRTVGYLKRILGVWPLYWSLYYPALGTPPPDVHLGDDCPRELAPFLNEQGGACYEK